MRFSTALLGATLVAGTAVLGDSCGDNHFVPLPQTAIGPPVSNVTGYRIESFGKGAYMVTDGIYQCMFLVATESVIVVDSPPTLGSNLLKAIRSVTPLPVSHLVYSHAHADHIGGAYLIANNPNVTIIAHSLTAYELSLTPDSKRPPPTFTIEDEYVLKVCNQTLRLKYEGLNHEPGNIFIYAPEQRVLMLVDIVFPGWVPFAYLGEAQTVPGFIKAHDQILQYNFKHYIGGHLNRVGTREDVKIQREYVNDLYNNCAQAIALSASPPNSTNPISAFTLFPPIQASNPGNAWAEFKVYTNAVVNYCVNATNQKWLTRLGGADAFGFENGYAMIESLRIDYDVLGPFAVQS
ncbi:hypothetical protein MMC30_000156 [Trapelia coarctata]|nr:hypothetical protein [Trapelia coarctata]